MSTALETVLSSIHSDAELWLRCEPLSNHPPRDQPRVRELNREYRTARLYAVMPDGDERWIGDWFSLPIRNLFGLVERGESGEVDIRVDSLSQDDRLSLFDDTELTFHIGRFTTEQEWLWCSDDE